MILLGSICCTLLLVVNMLKQYNEHRVLSTTRYQRENPANLPTISVCPVNPFNTEFALDLLNAANVSISDEEDMNDAYWRIFMQLEDYLNETRGYGMTEEEKNNLTYCNWSIWFSYEYLYHKILGY